jgi:hypothetical protein
MLGDYCSSWKSHPLCTYCGLPKTLWWKWYRQHSNILTLLCNIKLRLLVSAAHSLGIIAFNYMCGTGILWVSKQQQDMPELITEAKWMNMWEQQEKAKTGACFFFRIYICVA